MPWIQVGLTADQIRMIRMNYVASFERIKRITELADKVVKFAVVLLVGAIYRVCIRTGRGGQWGGRGERGAFFDLVQAVLADEVRFIG